MDRNVNGYIQEDHKTPLKRYCQVLDLKEDPDLIAAYRHIHSEVEIWQEILDGIRSVGILEMEIYLCGTRLVMIVEAPLDFDWETAMTELSSLPRQQEWERYVAQYQQCASNASSSEKWQMAERIFHLYKKGLQ